MEELRGAYNNSVLREVNPEIDAAGAGKDFRDVKKSGWKRARGPGMKDITELVTPHDIRYTREHQWARPVGNIIRIGVTDYAQEQLGEIAFVELPEVGKTFKKGDVFGTLESVKAVAEVYMPVSGKITGVNTALEGSPDLVNTFPYADGWMVDMEPSDPSEMNDLMDHDAYLDMLNGV